MPRLRSNNLRTVRSNYCALPVQLNTGRNNSLAVLFSMADPRVWGTDLWASMHRISLAYPLARPTAAQRNAAQKFFASIAELLPCIGCRTHYASHFQKTFQSSTTDSRAALARWVYDLHEAVNKRLGKPTGAVKFEDLPKLYNAYPNRYVSVDGTELLEEPRFTTLANDFAGAETEIEKSDAVRRATTVYDALALSKEAEKDALLERMQRSTNMFWIGFAVLAVLSVAAVLLAVQLSRRQQQPKRSVTPTAARIDSTSKQRTEDSLF